MRIRLVACCLAGAVILVILFARTEIALTADLPSLPKVESALTSSERILARIDVSELSVQYREGKYIENARARMLKYIEWVHIILTKVSEEVRMVDLLLLLTTLNKLNSQFDVLILQLDRPITVGDHSRMKALEWAAALSKSATLFSNATLDVEDEAFRWAQSVDKKLVNCR